MSEEEIRKIAKEEFMNNVMKQLNSSLIFTYIQNLENQLQQKENIIKEVREYIEMHTPSDIGICGNKTKRYYTLGEDSVDHILEILDKEVN